MKYFKDSAGDVWAFEDDGSQDELVTPQMVAMTEAEVEAHLNPPPSLQELAAFESAWRDAEMPAAQQNVTAIEYGEEGIPGTAQDWRKYWLALRKWSDTNPDFPDSSKRPVAPS